jgi:ferric-dicitrate binding protein FerR (iron transport regulator)
MIPVDKFAGYSAIQLATEATFISWIKCPHKASDIFWKEYINKYPLQADVVQKAKIIVDKMYIVQPIMDATISEETWEKIKNQVDQEPFKKSHQSLIKIRRWMTAAAIFIAFLGVGSYFLIFNKTSNKVAGKVNPSHQNNKNDIAPGGNKAILTLGDGSTIVLDSAQNGILTQQGNTKVIKLDNGQLAYKPTKNNKELKIEFNSVTTPRGGQYQLVLSDGSKIWLNASSSIRFPAIFKGHERDVEITGEAYFEVAHNPKMPFHVRVNDMDVQVLGTHFNINAYEDDNVIKTTLLEGSVKVSKGSLSALIAPGEQARIVKTLDKIMVKKGINLDEVVSWKNGYFDFEELDFETIAKQLSRWYDVEVIYKRPIDDLFYAKIPRNTKLSVLLKALELTGKVHFEIEGKKIIVLP